MVISPAERAVQATLTSIAPASFDNNSALYAWNLFLMTAAVGIGLLMLGLQLRLIWRDRLCEHPLNPLTLWRTMLAFAGAAFALRGGVEATHLWAWSSGDTATIAAVIQAKRWIDPISIFCIFAYFAMAVLARPGIETQLKKRPIPIDMWSRWPALRKPVTMIGLAFGMAIAAVAFR